MDKVSRWPARDRADLFREAAASLGITPAVVEKDFWVCWLLGKLFADRRLSPIILLKGGTSLSKAFGLIKRFSEDVDLILDWNEVFQEDPYRERSRTKQERFNKNASSLTCAYLNERVLPIIRDQIEGICEAFVDEKAPGIISLRYPLSFPESYLRPEVQLELGPLAAWLPNDEYRVTSYAAEALPEPFTHPSASIRAIKAERTFWEKATILHQEAHRPAGKPQPPRYSRHYYDLAMMSRAEVRSRALADTRLLREVVEFKNRFYPCGWARYEEAGPGTFRLLPPEFMIRSLAADYRQMQIMIFGEAPGFEPLMRDLKSLEEEINTLAAPRPGEGATTP